MRLLVYSHFFSPSVGGVETVVFNLARGLAELRLSDGQAEFKVTVVTQIPSEPLNDREFPFRVVRQPRLTQLWHLIRSSEVIHLAGPAFSPLALGMLARIPIVLEHHGYQSICPNGLLLHHPSNTVCPGHFKLRHYFECLRCNSFQSTWVRSCVSVLLMFPRCFLARRVAANVAVSQHVLNRIGGQPNASIVHHGIDTSLDTKLICVPILAMGDKLCFAYVGRLVREKGISVLLEATRILRKENLNFEVRVIGDGPERPRLERQIMELEISSCVNVLGFLTGSALERALEDVGVVILPTVMEETAGLAVMEQMLRGRLVIASDIGGLSEVVAESGLRFPPGDAVALASAMREVIQQPSIIHSLGQKARSRALDSFSLERMVESHARIYRRLLNVRN